MHDVSVLVCSSAIIDRFAQSAQGVMNEPEIPSVNGGFPFSVFKRAEKMKPRTIARRRRGGITSVVSTAKESRGDVPADVVLSREISGVRGDVASRGVASQLPTSHQN